MTRAELIRALECDPQPDKVLDFWCWWYGRSTEADRPDPKPPPADYVRNKLGYPWTFRPTASLDHALTLIAPGTEYQIRTLYGIADVEVGLNFADRASGVARRKDGNVILAVCTAALRART